jgi:HlyD family secretion protein
MIKNAWAVGVVLLAGGCARHSEADAFQGVIEYEERDLAFEVTGRITEIDVVEGDRLATGAPIARVAPDLEQSALTARESEARAAAQEVALLQAGSRPEDVRARAAQAAAARASEALLRTNAERTRKLYAAQATPRAALDEAEAQLSRAEAETRAAEEALLAARRGARPQEVRAAEDRLAAARASSDQQRGRVSRYELRALDPGEVLEVHFRTGEMAVAGVPVVTVADTARPYADVFVPQAAVGGVAVGAPAHARVDSLGHEIAGRVERIYRRTEFTPRYLFSKTERANLVVRVRVRFDDPGRELHAGVPVFVRVDRAAGGAAP